MLQLLHALKCPYVRLRPLQLSSSELSDAQKGRSQKRNSWAPRPQRLPGPLWRGSMWQQRQRQLSIRRSLRWKFDGCERGTAVDSVGSSGEMARRFYVDEELLYVFKTAEMQMRSSFMSRLHQDWSGLLEKVNLQFSRRLSYEMWAMGLEERTCAPKEYYGNSRLCKALVSSRAYCWIWGAPRLGTDLGTRNPEWTKGCFTCEIH